MALPLEGCPVRMKVPFLRQGPEKHPNGEEAADEIDAGWPGPGERKVGLCNLYTDQTHLLCVCVAVGAGSSFLL